MILIDIFNDTYNRCKTEPYLQESIRHSQQHSQLYSEKKYPLLHEESKRYDHTTVIVDNFRTFESAKRWANSSLKVGVLNFACSLKPGGRVWNGSKAQEESLCRCSTLYLVLDDDSFKGTFYHYKHDFRYNDACIYSPDITVFKTDEAFPQELPFDEWYKVDVLTCAAPNLSHDRYISDMELYGIHVKRGIHILTIAASHKIDILILGAFGCGAFHNNPQVVAEAYKQVVKQFDGYFKEIVFSIYCPNPFIDNVNYKAFKSIQNK